MKTQLNGRTVYFSVYGNDLDDIHIEEAYYEDNDDPLSDEEIVRVQNENAGRISEAWFEKQVSAAEAWCDFLQDR